ncbi:MAG TPA: hypothetical protein VGD65_23020 [Chryseosolibacter sp.]
MEVRNEHLLTYVNRPEEILEELYHSKTFGNVVGIFAISLGPIMIMTAVDDIIDIKHDKLIVLKETDLLGIKVPEEQIFLSEIVRVHSFKTRFDDPFHVKLREATSDGGPNAGLAQ